MLQLLREILHLQGHKITKQTSKGLQYYSAIFIPLGDAAILRCSKYA